MNETTQHTPGPWMVDPNDDFKIISEDWGGIGLVYNEPAENEAIMAMARANASLIAAAPDLLAALDMMVEQVEFKNRVQGGYGHFAVALSNARAAIAKAKGAE